MSAQRNKHGLSRYIPKTTKAKIRQAAGYGCVMCGYPIIEYEHIEPEFKDATEHDPSRITLLCPTHHAEKTKGILSKEKIYSAMKCPAALKFGVLRNLLHPTNDKCIRLGSGSFGGNNDVDAVLVVHQRPLIWFEPSSTDDEPRKLCAIFYDNNGKQLCFINRNELIIPIQENDRDFDFIQCSTSFTIKHKNTIVFKMKATGNSTLKIEKLNMNYYGMPICVDGDKLSLGKILADGITVGGTFIFGSKIPHCGFKSLKLLLESIIYKMGITSIKSYSGITVGKKIGEYLYSHDYNRVGYIKENSVFSITNEFIGFFNNGYIQLNDNAYQSGEPIWISPTNKLNIYSKVNSYDLSYRLFGQS